MIDVIFFCFLDIANPNTTTTTGNSTSTANIWGTSTIKGVGFT